MSRLIMAAMLGVLALLLFVMAKVVNPMPEPPPPPPTAAQKEAEEAKNKAKMDAMIKQEQSQMAANRGIEQAHQQGMMPKPQEPAKPPTAASKPPRYGDMQLSEDWFRTRKPGAEGLQTLEKEDAAKKKAWDAYLKEHPSGPTPAGPTPPMAHP